MPAEMDLNDIAAKIAVETFERSYSSISRTVDSIFESMSVRLKSKYAEYKTNSSESYGYVRTLLHRDVLIPIRDLYVEMEFSNAYTRATDLSIISMAANPCRILIRGTAGGGKSVFLRLLNLVACESSSQILPIFIELKELNDTDFTIDDLVAEYLTKNGLDYSDATLQKIITEGRTLFILDGFDEIHHDKRYDVAKQISQICKYRKNTSVIISSRPDDVLSSVERLSTYDISPLSISKSIALLSKLPYDQSVKEKFIYQIDENFYKTHQQFLSNPLLATMMLMTYHQCAEIPNKVYLFYENAFATLFNWHDSAKNVFRRKSHTNLPPDEFRSVFSYFCFDTYNDEKFQFLEVDLIEKLNQAISTERIDCNSVDLMNDLITSVCLMQRDGIYITFVHRSFQEYFSAYFISKLDGKNAFDAVESCVQRVSSDLVLPMLHAMAPKLFEKNWALPTVKSLISNTKGIDPKIDPVFYLSKSYSFLSVQNKQIHLTYRDKRWGHRLLAIMRAYPRENSENRVRSDHGVVDFIHYLTEDATYREKVEREIGETLNLDKVFTGEYRFPLDGNPKSLEEYLQLSERAQKQSEYLKTLEFDITERLRSRDRGFKAALGRTRPP